MLLSRREVKRIFGFVIRKVTPRSCKVSLHLVVHSHLNSYVQIVVVFMAEKDGTPQINTQSLFYRCNRKLDKGKHKCMTPTLSEDEIKMKFIQSYNFTMKDKKRVMDDTKEIIGLLSDTKDLDVEINKTGDEITVITELVNKLINNHAKSNMSIDEYDRRYSELTIRYEELEIKQKELINKRDDKKARGYIINEFLSNLKHAKDKMTEWNDSFFTMMVESGRVHRDETITFKLKNGKEIKS